MPQLGSVTRSPPPSPKYTLPARSPPSLPFIVPPGWTTRPGSPSFEYEWDGVNSAGQKIARGYGLAPGRPILEDDDASTMIFQSGDKLYIWDVLYHDVYEIASQDVNEVARVLSQEGGYKKLQKSLLDPVEDIAV
ncbi:hypothetical protein N7491_004415 [Penicillium cf. griseofulvum]|uniref:Uncharacterized protein n=1 Tax=Penicillium cf. griseofulvum TaxID=2972120 RepID=A0A9W9J0F7_9EURO|nr:hypothetical protein N7472_007104 [Penicillium cf. griseofulvum]KAJ5433820.1 hypothetical protein N7491_004415 [Penicillium cf. griseofulvum]